MNRTLSIHQMLTFGVAVFGIGMMNYAITVFLLFYIFIRSAAWRNTGNNDARKFPHNPFGTQ